VDWADVLAQHEELYARARETASSTIAARGRFRGVEVAV
jgi:hypothetical protein